MSQSPEDLHYEIEQVRRRFNERCDELEKRVDLMAKGHDKILEVMQGDVAWKRKGVIDQLAEVAAFMAEMKGFDFKQMKDFATEYNDLKKRALWTSTIAGSLVGLLWLLFSNLDKIQKLLH